MNALTGFLIAALALGGTIWLMASTPTLAECRAIAGPSGQFATYNLAAKARCDGHIETWSSRFAGAPRT